MSSVNAVSRNALVLLCFIGGLLVPKSALAIIEIPEDYDHIQDGIHAAVPGDTILISPGTYIEEIEIQQKDLTLGSLFLTTGDTTFIRNTILDGDSTLHILTCYGPHTITISGLTFTNGYGQDAPTPNQWYGGAISVVDTTVLRIEYTRLESNYGHWCPGITAYDSCSVAVSNSSFQQNTSLENGKLIWNSQGELTSLYFCEFVDNDSRSGCLITLNSNKVVEIRNCMFQGNHNTRVYDSTQPMIIYATAEVTTLSECSFTNNYLSRHEGMIGFAQSDSLSISNCIIDSTYCDHALDESLINVAGNDIISLNNIWICDNYSIDGDGFGIGIYAMASQSLTADSIFIQNNYEEYEYDKIGMPGCRFYGEYNCHLSHIYITGNTTARSDLDEYPDEYASEYYVTQIRGRNLTLEHFEKAYNVNDFSQLGIGLSIHRSSSHQVAYLNNILIHDNIRNYTSPYDEFNGYGSGILTETPTWRKLEINNLRIYNQYNTLYGSAIRAQCDTVIIRNAHISDCGNNAITLSTECFYLDNLLVHDCWDIRGESSSHIVFGTLEDRAEIRNCSIVDSYADYGKSIYVGTWGLNEEQTALVANCIVENTCQDGEAIGYNPYYNMDFTIQYSNIDGGWEGEGNIDLDPMFADPENDDYTFLPNSPCIDAGNPDPQYNDPEDPNDPGFPLWPSQGTLRNDMGCYGGPGAIDLWEYQEDVPIGLQPAVQPATIELRQNYPNPFNPTTTIEFTLPYPQRIQLVVYNLLGQQIAILAEGPHQAGIHQATFDGSGLASGVYIYRLVAGNQMITKKMALVK